MNKREEIQNSDESEKRLTEAGFLLCCLNDWSYEQFLKFLIDEDKISYWRLFNQTVARRQFEAFSRLFSSFRQKYLNNRDPGDPFPVKGLIPKDFAKQVLLLVDDEREHMGILFKTELGKRVFEHLKVEEETQQQEKLFLEAEDRCGGCMMISLIFFGNIRSLFFPLLHRCLKFMHIILWGFIWCVCIFTNFYQKQYNKNYIYLVFLIRVARTRETHSNSWMPTASNQICQMISIFS